MSPGPVAVNPDAIVVGGGFAGLSAATALAARGVRVLVLEARPTLGGRATAFTDPITGDRVDNGQHVLFGCYHETFAFLRRIGALRHVQLQRDLAIDFVSDGGRPSRLACPRLPTPFHLLAGVLRWNALSVRDRLSVLGMRRAVSAARQSETVRQWLERHRQTPRLIELLWEPLGVAALNQSIDIAAAAPFAAVLGRMFGSSPSDAALALPLKPLDELYALPARDFIVAHGGEVRTNSPARIACDPLRVFVRDGELHAAHVICAVAWHALGETLPDPPSTLVPMLRAAALTGASPIVTVNLWFDRIVTDRTFVGLPDGTFQWLFDKRLLFGDESSHLSLVASGAEGMTEKPNAELTGRAVAEVRAALPLARTAGLLRSVVVREKRASFSVAPGQPARPPTITGVAGLLLAGDWIDTGLPATIEGAVVSGHRAAALVSS